MAKLLYILIFFIFSAGCTLYKSPGRDQFEKASLQTTTLSSETPYQMIKCQKQGALEAWFNQEFPRHNYEMVLSGLDFEIWKTDGPSYIEVIALQKIDKTTQSCTYHFFNEDTWNKYQEQFTHEIENNFLLAD